MAKTPPLDEAPAPPAFDEAALRAWVLTEIAKAKAPDVPPGLEKMVKDQVDAQCADIKAWVRREVSLNACGASDEEREDMNP